MKSKKNTPKKRHLEEKRSSATLLDVSFILNMVLIVALVYVIIGDETEFYKGISQTYKQIAQDSLKQSQEVLESSHKVIADLKECKDQLYQPEVVMTARNQL